MKLILPVTVPWKRGQLVVPTEPTPWPPTRHQRASVNSFGIGGSNCRKSCNTKALRIFLWSLNYSQTSFWTLLPRSALVKIQALHQTAYRDSRSTRQMTATVQSPDSTPCSSISRVSQSQWLTWHTLWEVVANIMLIDRSLYLTDSRYLPSPHQAKSRRFRQRSHLSSLDKAHSGPLWAPR